MWEHARDPKHQHPIKMKKYYQLLLVLASVGSVVALLIYRHEYYRLRYVLEVLNFFGKPGTASDPELCGYGINSSILADKLDLIHSQSIDTFPYFQRIDDNHYAYSSFWRKTIPHAEITVQSQFYGVSDTIVLGAKHAKQNFRCHFLFEEIDRQVIGKFSYSRLESKASVKQSKDFTMFIFHCKLPRSIGLPYAVSFYPNSDNNPIFSPVIKMVDLDKGQIMLKSDKNMSGVTFQNTSKITACVMPTELPLLDRRSAIEFLAFHKLMGITEFHVYDNSISPNILETVQLLPVELTGFVIHILPFNFPFSSENSYHLMRDAAELDCSFRNLNRNKRTNQKDLRGNEKTGHIVQLSWDEFIVPRYHHSLKVLLSLYEAGKKAIKLQLPSLHFCLNQKDDPKVKADYPNVIKKTHFDKSATGERPSYIYNIGSLTVNDIEISTTFEFHSGADKNKLEKMSLDILAVHKYSFCREGGANRPFNNVDMDFADFETRPHQFEGAMLGFSDDLYNSKLYTLYRMGKIWPISTKTN